MSNRHVHEPSPDEVRAFTKALLVDLQALEEMLRRGMIESGVRRFGAEQEAFLVDRAYHPSPSAPEVLERLGYGAFTTELARLPPHSRVAWRPLSPRGRSGPTVAHATRIYPGVLHVWDSLPADPAVLSSEDRLGDNREREVQSVHWVIHRLGYPWGTRDARKRVDQAAPQAEDGAQTAQAAKARLRDRFLAGRDSILAAAVHLVEAGDFEAAIWTTSQYVFVGDDDQEATHLQILAERDVAARQKREAEIEGEEW